MAHFDINAMKGDNRYPSVKGMIEELSSVLIPPERIAVHEAAEKYRRVYNPPAYTGPWDNEIGPYLIEPMDCLESRDYSAVCVVAPAQSMKTEIIINWAAYSIVCDPSDMMIVEKAQTEAKMFSQLKLDRTLRHSPELNSRRVDRRSADNTFDKQFKSGTMIQIAWPTVNALSGKTIRRVALTDYDRMVQDVGGEGSPFDLGRRRTNTYKRLGKTYVESSPSFDVQDPRWRPETPHQAPPCDGILGIYNRGDRRRRYWKCPHCGWWFEPSFAALRWVHSDDPMECAESAFMACPHCFDRDGAIITQSMRNELDQGGIWLRDGQKIDHDDNITGKARRSDIASFWIKGPNTAFAQWKTLVLNKLLAEQEYESNGNDRPLKTTINTDQGEAYIPPHVANVRAPEDLMDRAEDLPEKVVPQGVRFLVATVDVQGNRFEVQVHGVKPAVGTVDLVVIDRFAIRKSKRKDEDGDKLWVNPGSYPEDWNLITEQVIERTYPVEDLDKSKKPRHMAIRAVGCDSGGKAGVTTNAYKYYRKVRKAGYGGRFFLLKGDPRPNGPRVQKTYPDSERKDRNAGARGEIPVLLMNSNLLKDWLDAALGREDPGGGYIHFPDWLSLEFFRELCIEIKNEKGKWDNPKNKRQEAWDLLYYCYALCIHLRAERMDWDNPFPWAREWDSNTLVSTAEHSVIKPADKPTSDVSTSLAELAAKLG